MNTGKIENLPVGEVFLTYSGRKRWTITAVLKKLGVAQCIDQDGNRRRFPLEKFVRIFSDCD